MRVPEVCFVDVGDVRLAWSQVGSGPDVLAIPPLVSNAELGWEHELYRRFLEYVAEHVRVTEFDKRGIGLSDKFCELPMLQQRTDDITAVMDAAGLDHAVVLGHSEGALMAQLFAAQRPERVERLVL
jgi:pimeloyl-ACP methyl ester carboxylesterase